MNKLERQNHIVQLIEQAGNSRLMGTKEIADQFGVSEMTVRRDLQELSLEGLLMRQHGGAMATRPSIKKPSKEIGILLVSSTGKYQDPFFNTILEGADRKLKELNYHLAYINTQTEIKTPAQAHDLLQSHPVDGIILVGFVNIDTALYLKNNIRAIVKTTDTVGPEFDTITFDGFYGIQQMVSHLVRVGRRRLGFIAGSTDSRLHGFMDAVKTHGLPDSPELIHILPFGLDGWTPELGHIGAERLMNLANPPDAIVCGSDRVAIGALQWLHQNNFKVPYDVSVTGFDNIAESAFTAPSLTTVHIHKELMGELAAERTVKQIENPDEIPLLIQTPTHLVIRESCGGRS